MVDAGSSNVHVLPMALGIIGLLGGNERAVDDSAKNSEPGSQKPSEKR